MPFQEITSREYVIRLPDQNGKPGAEIARISACENSPVLLLRFNQKVSYKELRTGIKLLPIHAQFIGHGLMQAADLAQKAFPTKPPDIT